MRIVAIIPAREGSKRLKHKNVYPIKGKPLVEYTIDAALGSKYLDRDNLFISTDFKDVMSIGINHDINVIPRPKDLATDKVWTQDVVNHVDDELHLREEDIIVILQANSPQMTSKKIDECVEKLLDNNLWQVHTVDETFINNGAIHVMRRKVRSHQGKVNYNGVVMTNWVDVHTIEDVRVVEKLL